MVMATSYRCFCRDWVITRVDKQLVCRQADRATQQSSNNRLKVVTIYLHTHPTHTHTTHHTHTQHTHTHTYTHTPTTHTHTHTPPPTHTHERQTHPTLRVLMVWTLVSLQRGKGRLPCSQVLHSNSPQVHHCYFSAGMEAPPAPARLLTSQG